MMTVNKRDKKNALYGQVARIAKAVSSPKRLELIELLCQGSKPVQQLADESNISMKLASAHLKELKASQLVETERQGKNVFYRLASESVSHFWVAARLLAENRLVELRAAMRDMQMHVHEWKATSREELLDKVRSEEIVLIDVRPLSEYLSGHLPQAQSIPIDELNEKIQDLPKNKVIVAYCRGPFCFWASEAVELLRSHGYEAFQLREGVAEWAAKAG